MKPKKNTRKKETLSSDEGDEPCVCGHVRRSHLGFDASLCFGCYAAPRTHDKKGEFNPSHKFKLDNLALIERLYSRKELEEFKNENA
jgi:hypothetical protein